MTNPTPDAGYDVDTLLIAAAQDAERVAAASPTYMSGWHPIKAQVPGTLAEALEADPDTSCIHACRPSVLYWSPDLPVHCRTDHLAADAAAPARRPCAACGAPDVAADDGYTFASGPVVVTVRLCGPCAGTIRADGPTTMGDAVQTLGLSDLAFYFQRAWAPA